MVFGVLLVIFGLRMYMDPRIFVILLGVVFYLIGVDNYLLANFKESIIEEVRGELGKKKAQFLLRKNAHLRGAQIARER